MASSIYIGGSIGFELIGGYYAELHGLKNLAYNMLTSTEESLEMAGIILFIWGLLTYIADSYKDVQFCFDECSGEIIPDGPHKAQQSIEAERKWLSNPENKVIHNSGYLSIIEASFSGEPEALNKMTISYSGNLTGGA